MSLRAKKYDAETHDARNFRPVLVETLIKGRSRYAWENKWYAFRDKKIRIWGGNFRPRLTHRYTGGVFGITFNYIATNDMVSEPVGFVFAPSWKPWARNDDGLDLYKFIEMIDYGRIGKGAYVLVDSTDPHVPEFLEQVAKVEAKVRINPSYETKELVE